MLKNFRQNFRQAALAVAERIGLSSKLAKASTAERRKIVGDFQAKTFEAMATPSKHKTTSRVNTTLAPKSKAHMTTKIHNIMARIGSLTPSTKTANNAPIAKASAPHVETLAEINLRFQDQDNALDRQLEAARASGRIDTTLVHAKADLNRAWASATRRNREANR